MVMRCVLWSCEACLAVIIPAGLKVLEVHFGDSLFTWLCCSDFDIRKSTNYVQHSSVWKHCPRLRFLVSEQVYEQRWTLQNFLSQPSAVLLFQLDADAP